MATTTTRIAMRFAFILSFRRKTACRNAQTIHPMRFRPKAKSEIVRRVRSATHRRSETKKAGCRKSSDARFGRCRPQEYRRGLHPVPARGGAGRRAISDVRGVCETLLLARLARRHALAEVRAPRTGSGWELRSCDESDRAGLHAWAIET